MRWSCKLVIPVLAGLSLLGGCASPSGKAGIDPGSGFGLDVGFKAVDMCQNVSPEVRLKNVPPGTKKVNLKVLDFDFGTELFNQDFGFETTNTGLYINGDQAMVPKGSMYGRGQMPCPKDKPSTVKVQVKALDANDRELGNVSVVHHVNPEP